MAVAVVKIALPFLWCLATLTACSNLAASSNLQLLSTCACLGQNVSYECTVEGGAFTVWSGSAFMCQSREISLRHIRFLDAIGDCNNGAIIGKGITISNNSYTSHLYVTLSTELIGRSVYCSLDDGINFLPIGTRNLSLSIDPFPSPARVYLDRVGPHEITFRWDIVSHSYCPSFHYRILGINCGTCSPNITESNRASCTNFNNTLTSSTNNICNFTVQSIICENIAGNMSYLLIRLKVPDALVVRSIPHYLFREGYLIRIDTSFKVADSFNISTDQRIDGSATSYTISFVDSTSGLSCGSDKINATSCKAGLCYHMFDLSSSSCPNSADITVTVFASNILGSGNNSAPVNICGTNNMVNVTIDQRRSIVCQFPNLQQAETECIANITHGPNCDQQVGIYKEKNNSNLVIIPPLEIASNIVEYCLSINATNGNSTVIVQGTLVDIGQRNEDGTVRIAVAVSIICIAFVVLMTIIILLSYFCTQKPKIIAFSVNKKKEDSLANALKVFEDHGIAVISVNTHFHHARLHLGNWCRFQYYYVFCSLKSEQEPLLKNLPNLELIESDHNRYNSPTTVKFKVPRRKRAKAIRMTLKTFHDNDIPVLGLNSRIDHESTSGYRDHSVKCYCSGAKLERIKETFSKKDVIFRDAWIGVQTKPTTWRIAFCVISQDKASVISILQVFNQKQINIDEVNPEYIMYDPNCRTEFLDKNNYVEFSCSQDKVNTLKERLVSAKYGALNVIHLTEEQISAKLESCRKFKEKNGSFCTFNRDLSDRQQKYSADYNVISFSVVSESGSLARALQVFLDDNFNFIGINTIGCFDNREHFIECDKVILEFSCTDGQEEELIRKLKATGFVVSAEAVPRSEGTPSQKCTRKSLELLISKEKNPGSFSSTIQVFAEVGIDILNTPLDTASAVPSGPYDLNHVQYTATEEEHESLLKELNATGKVYIKGIRDMGPTKKKRSNKVGCLY